MGKSGSSDEAFHRRGSAMKRNAVRGRTSLSDGPRRKSRALVKARRQGVRTAASERSEKASLYLLLLCVYNYLPLTHTLTPPTTNAFWFWIAALRSQ